MFNRLLTKFLELNGKAAETLEKALSKANKELFGAVDSVIFNYVGEDAAHLKEIYKATVKYYSILKIAGSGKEISIKPSQFGDNTVLLERLAKEVCKKRTILWIDAEEYEKSKKQLKLALDLSSSLDPRPEDKRMKYSPMGLCIQLKSYNCERHARKCFENNIKVRLCKGAYSTAYKPEPSALLDRAKRIVGLHNEYDNDLLEIATIRDIKLIMLALENELPLQILYGYHQELLDYPFKVKVYLPFGTRWWPYMIRRMKEKING